MRSPTPSACRFVSASSSDGWSRAQRRLHWAVAGLVVAGFAIGIIMVALPLTQLLAKILAYQAHKTIGLLVPPLVLWRLVLRARRGRPPEDPGIAAWQRRAAAIAQQLALTERLARQHGQAIAIGHPHPETLKALAQWIPALREKGLALVPLTALVRKPPGQISGRQDAATAEAAATRRP